MARLAGFPQPPTPQPGSIRLGEDAWTRTTQVEMPKPITAIDYGRRLERVARYIAENLDAQLTLEHLAGVAHFSVFHFHRIYREATGETVAATIRRGRLDRAAKELVAGTPSLAKIARRAGYGSAAAFTRAFAAAYGLPPAAYRRRAQFGSPAGPFAQTQEMFMYSVEIRDVPALRLAAVRHAGSYKDIGGSFERLFALAAPRGLLGPDSQCVGRYYDDPESVAQSALRSDACVTIAVGATADDALQVIEQPACRCAIARHRGPYAELERAYRWLFRTWLPQSGEEPDDQPCFELYLNDPRQLPPTEWLTDVCLPLKRR